MSDGVVHQLAPEVFDAWRWQPADDTRGGFEGSIDYFFSTVIVQLTPKQIAARRRNFLKSTAWNPDPKFGLRAEPFEEWRCASTDVNGGRYSFLAADT